MKKIWLLSLLIVLVGCANNQLVQNIGQDGAKMTESQARLIAEKSCIKGGEALGPGSYNPNSKTWWFDANLNATREGCNPACVVSEETKEAEINWRCTGLNIENGGKSNFSFDNKQLDTAVREFLQTQKVFSWQTVADSKNVCVFEKLDNDELFPHYLWVRCGEFVKNGELVEEKSGSLLPAKIDYPNELSFFDVNRFTQEIPGDGSLYVEDIKKIFPVELQERVLNYKADKVNQLVKQSAEQILLTR